MNDNKDLILIGNKFKAIVLKYELYIVLAVVADLLIKYLHVPFSGLISALLLSSVAIIYFFSAFSSHEETDLTAFDIFIYKICGFASSVVISGILFAIQNWPNALFMLIAGLSTLLVVLIYVLIQNNKRPELKLFNKWGLVRILVLIDIAIGLIYDKVK